MKKKYLISIQVIFWILLIFNEFISNKGSFSAIGMSGLFVNICTFYFNYFVIIPFVFKKNETIYYLLGLLAAFLFFIFLRYTIEEILFPIFLGFSNYNEGTGILYYIFDNFYWGSNTIFVSSLIWFLDYSLKIKGENQLLIDEKKSAEISLLKSQINPHFIFNTLNNIYSLVYQKSDKSLPAIEKLGDLLRFSGQAIVKDFIPLRSEIKYIESLLNLESLRLSDPNQVQVEILLENENIQIAPMILIPFIENAFKHGDLKTEPFICSIKNKGDNIEFYSKNKISSAEKDKTSGIGINNVRKRLEYIYSKNYELEINTENDFYEVNLIIKT